MSNNKNNAQNPQGKQLTKEEIEALKSAKNKIKNSTEPVKKC